jgi:hypothetical protein
VSEQPFDAANDLLAAGPCMQVTALLDTPEGQRMCYTVRTSSATVTALLTKEDATAWAKALTAEAGRMSGSGLVVAGANSLPVNRNGHS